MPLPPGSLSARDCSGYGSLTTVLKGQLRRPRQAGTVSPHSSAALRQADSPAASLPGARLICPALDRVSPRKQRKYVTSRQVVAASVSDVVDSLQPQSSSWEHLTQQLVTLSIVPFLLLMAPQVIKNASNFMAGNARALAALSWVVSSLVMPYSSACQNVAEAVIAMPTAQQWLTVACNIVSSACLQDMSNIISLLACTHFSYQMHLGLSFHARLPHDMDIERACGSPQADQCQATRSWSRVQAASAAWLFRSAPCFGLSMQPASLHTNGRLWYVNDAANISADFRPKSGRSVFAIQAQMKSSNNACLISSVACIFLIWSKI